MRSRMSCTDAPGCHLNRQYQSIFFSSLRRLPSGERLPPYRADNRRPARPRRNIVWRGPMVAIGVALVLVGAALLVAEAHLPSGALGVTGAVALAGGAALAISAAGGGLAIVLAAMFAAAGVAGLWLAVAARKALATRALRPSSGREALSGH